MIRKTITFTNFDDKKVTETHWFNMTRQQMIEWEMRTGEGLQEFFIRISQSGNKELLYEAFEDLLLRSYGIKSDDGSEHAKSPEISQRFKNTAAFDEFFMDFFSNEDKAMEFIRGIMPKDWVSDEAIKVVMETPDERFDAVNKAVQGSTMPPPPPDPLTIERARELGYLDPNPAGA